MLSLHEALSPSQYAAFSYVQNWEVEENNIFPRKVAHTYEKIFNFNIGFKFGTRL